MRVLLKEKRRTCMSLRMGAERVDGWSWEEANAGVKGGGGV
jgi:hypothetical protein